MTRQTFTLLFMLAIGIPGWTGDVAVFKNLGFSTDGRFFFFGQYGINSTEKTPWAETFAVDVKNNDFVPGGVTKGVFPVAMSIGDDGQKALYVQLEQSAPLRKRLKVDFLNQGRPIYFRMVTETEAARADSLKVLDYQSGREYSLELQETKQTLNGQTSSSFTIQLEVRTKEGNLVGTWTMGSPKISRPGVSNYTITQVILAPGEKSMVVVVEKETQEPSGGISIRHMVETLTF